jgi:hypothetical protein
MWNGWSKAHSAFSACPLAIQPEGTVQPVAADLKRKKTFLEDNAQFPRKIMIA